MTKQQVMEALLDANSNVPANVVSYVGTNLSDDVVCTQFNHNANSLWEACGIVEKDTEEFSEAVNKYMNALPEGESCKSKAVEFVVNSGNRKWITIAVLTGLQASSVSPKQNETDEFKDFLLKALMRRLKGNNED